MPGTYSESPSLSIKFNEHFMHEIRTVQHKVAQHQAVHHEDATCTLSLP